MSRKLVKLSIVYHDQLVAWLVRNTESGSSLKGKPV